MSRNLHSVTILAVCNPTGCNPCSVLNPSRTPVATPQPVPITQSKGKPLQPLYVTRWWITRLTGTTHAICFTLGYLWVLHKVVGYLQPCLPKPLFDPQFPTSYHGSPSIPQRFLLGSNLPNIEFFQPAATGLLWDDFRTEIHKERAARPTIAVVVCSTFQRYERFQHYQTFCRQKTTVKVKSSSCDRLIREGLLSLSPKYGGELWKTNQNRISLT